MGMPSILIATVPMIVLPVIIVIALTINVAATHQTATTGANKAEATAPPDSRGESHAPCVFAIW
jgi:hypothetical protein